MKLNSNCIEKVREMMLEELTELKLYSSSNTNLITVLGCLGAKSYIFAENLDKHSFNDKKGIEQFEIDRLSFESINWAVNEVGLLDISNIVISEVFNDNGSLCFTIGFSIKVNQNVNLSDISTIAKLNNENQFDLKDFHNKVKDKEIKCELMFLSKKEQSTKNKVSKLFYVKATQYDTSLANMFSSFVHICRNKYFEQKGWQKHGLEENEETLKNKNITGILKWIFE